MPELLNLTATELALYEQTLLRSHERRVSFETLRLNGTSAGMLDIEPTEGNIAVTGGGETEVSRVLTLKAADRTRQLDFTPDSPGEALFFTRQLRVYDERYVPGLGWVRAVPFTGPIWSFTRTGNEVDLVAHSVDRLCMGALWSFDKLRQGQRKSNIIRDLLLHCGFTAEEIAVPLLAPTLGSKKTLDRFESPWAHAWRLADGMNVQLYPTGPGRIRVRDLPGTVAFTWRAGDGGSVLSDPRVARAMDGWRTDVVVIGKKPKGSRNRAGATVKVPADHPLSAVNLGRNGKARHLAERIEDTNLGTNEECRKVGQRRINEATRSLVEAAFESAPIPHLNPGDLVALELPEGSINFRLWEFTIPLLPAEASIGKVRRGA